MTTTINLTAEDATPKVALLMLASGSRFAVLDFGHLATVILPGVNAAAADLLRELAVAAERAAVMLAEGGE